MKKSVWIGLILVFMLALVLAGIFFIKPTGKVLLEIQESYALNEKLSG